MFKIMLENADVPNNITFSPVFLTRCVMYMQIWNMPKDITPNATKGTTMLPETNTGVVKIRSNGLANTDKPNADGIANIKKYFSEYFR